MKIPIPEFNCFENSSLNALKAILCIIDYKIEKLSQKHELNVINNIEGYATTFAIKILKNLQTLTSIIEVQKDYSATCSLVRILADNIATYNLIYNCNDKQELFFRHYLYIADGFQTRLNILQNTPIQKNNKEPYLQQIKRQVKTTIENDTTLLKYINTILQEHSFKKQNYEAFLQITHQNNWKYKTLSKNKKNRYSWEELYNKLEPYNKNLSFFSYLSQFIHGLSISNIILDENNEEYDLMTELTISLTGNLNSTLDNLFNEELKIIINNYKTSTQFKEHISYYSPEYRDIFEKILTT